MACYFFDTSALVRRHVQEPGHAWVRSITRSSSGHVVIVALITAVEMVSAITRRQRGGSLSPTQGGSILGHFRRQLIDRYAVIDITRAHLTTAITLSRTHGLRAYDAVQLAVALEVDLINQQIGLGSVILVSADRELNAAATTEGLVVDDPSLH